MTIKSLSGTLLHETPECIPEYGQWVCSCEGCRIAVNASKEHAVDYIVKGERGRERVSAYVLSYLMNEGELDSWAEGYGLGYVREVFVAEVQQ